MPRPSSRYAKEGTAAHKVAELTLQGDIFLPDKIEIEGDEYIVSPGMCRALNPYVTHVEALRALPDAQVFLETRLVVPHTEGMVWGTLDCGVHTRSSLHIVDLKFGKGHIVDPDTPQLKLYALAFSGFTKAVGRGVNVVLTICQPRVGNEPLHSYVTTVGELQDWRDEAVRPAVLKIKRGDTTENAGPHCRWCVRKTECQAFARKHQTHAAAIFDDGGPFT